MAKASRTETKKPGMNGSQHSYTARSGEPVEDDFPQAPPRPFVPGPQVIPIPVCEKCGSDNLVIVSTKGVRVDGRSFRRQKHRCNAFAADGKRCGHITIIMRPKRGGSRIDEDVVKQNRRLLQSR